jgi:PAS domain S-box-containing protein
MPLACRNRWIIYCYYVIFIGLIAYGPMVDLSRSQTQNPNPLENKNILILNSFESNIPAFDKTIQGLSSALQSGGIGTKNQFYEHLDLARNPGPENRELLMQLMRQRYSERRIDFIITLYTEGLKFLLDEVQTLFPAAPILALYLPQGFEMPATGRRIIPHILTPDFTRTLEIALKLVPGTKRVYIAAGIHPMDKWLERLARRDFQKWEDRLEFHYLRDLPLDAILTTVSSAPSDSIVFVTSYGQDVTGKYHTAVELSRQLARVSKVPIFGILDTLIGHGIVGGSLISFEYIGNRAGELVLDVLRGTQEGKNIPVVLKLSQLDTFDWRQLRHWNMDESALPRGSIIVNREFSLWDLRYYAIGGMVFILLQALLIIALLVQKRRRSLAEGLLRQKSKELDQFFKVSIDLFCIANTDGYFLRLSPAWERTLGYSKEEFMAQRFLDFVHPGDLVGTQGAISTLASQQKVVDFENRYRRKDGTYRWLEWSSAPLGKLIFAVARDVTERKRAEEALKERLHFEQLISDLSARLINLPSEKLDGEIEDALKVVLEFFQVDRCALLHIIQGRDAWKITHLASSQFAPPVPVGTMLPRSIHPWAYNRLSKRGEVILFSKVDDMPDEARVDKQTWRDWGIRSNLVIPLFLDKTIVYIIAINTVQKERDWPKEFIPRFRLLGEIFVSALVRKQAEAAFLESQRILQQNETDLRSLTGRLIDAQEQERSRLARELHDDLAQRLAVFAIEVGRLQQQLVNPSAAVQEQLGEMKKGIIDISQDVHNLSRQLHPSILDDLGLIKAVESECNSFSRREGIEVTFNHENISTAIPKNLALTLYRIIQEALHNVSKHACAEHVCVSLRGVGHDVLMSVQDDGIGFDPVEVWKRPGLGLSSMRERVRLVHGEFSIRSDAQEGTEIAVQVPLTRKIE